MVSLSPTSPPRPNLSSTPVGRSRSPRQHQQQVNRARSRSPLRRPIPSSPTAPGRYRRPTTSNLPSASLTLYNKVRRKYLDRRDGASIKDIKAAEGISYRTYSRKRPIAERQITDPSRFQTVLTRCLTGQDSTRLNQYFLGQNCQQVLDRPDMKLKRRTASTEGKII